MVAIALNEGTLTLNHEWPDLEQRITAVQRGEPVVSLEVDTDLGTAVVGLTYEELLDVAARVERLLGYYEEALDYRWN